MLVYKRVTYFNTKRHFRNHHVQLPSHIFQCIFTVESKLLTAPQVSPKRRTRMLPKHSVEDTHMPWQIHKQHFDSKIFRGTINVNTRLYVMMRVYFKGFWHVAGFGGCSLASSRAKLHHYQPGKIKPSSDDHGAGASDPNVLVLFCNPFCKELGGGFIFYFIFTSTWGNDPIWLAHIIQMGWWKTTN